MRNEARIKENLEPIDGLDVPLEPQNTQAQLTDGAPLGTSVRPGNGKSQADDESAVAA